MSILPKVAALTQTLGSLLLACAVLLSGFVIPVQAQEYVSPWIKDVSLGVGVDFSTGKYGTETRTDSLVIPVTVQWRPSTWLDLQAGLPYIYQTNTVSPAYVVNPGVTEAGNEVDQTGTTPKAGTYQPERTTSQNGIGDLSLQAGITFLPEGEYLPQLRALIYLKCPTGNREDWLGSGEFDEGIGLAVSRSLGDLSLYVEGLWVFQGGSDFLVDSGYTARDYLSYYGEIGYQATDSFIPALALRGVTPPSDELGGVAEARVKLAWKASEHVSLQLYAGIGLTTSSSDMTSGISLFYNF